MSEELEEKILHALAQPMSVDEIMQVAQIEDSQDQHVLEILWQLICVDKVTLTNDKLFMSKGADDV